MVRVGSVGFGFAVRTFHAPLIGAVEGRAIVAVSSSDAARVIEVLAVIETGERSSRMGARI